MLAAEDVGKEGGGSNRMEWMGFEIGGCPRLFLPY